MSAILHELASELLQDTRVSHHHCLLLLTQLLHEVFESIPQNLSPFLDVIPGFVVVLTLHVPQNVAWILKAYIQLLDVISKGILPIIL